VSCTVVGVSGSSAERKSAHTARPSPSPKRWIAASRAWAERSSPPPPLPKIPETSEATEITSISRQGSGPCSLPMNWYVPGISEPGWLTGGPALASAMYWLTPSV